MQTTYQVIIDDNYVVPTGTFLTNEEYVTFVMNMAAKSYMTQYNTTTVDDGITAARESYNANVPTETVDTTSTVV